MRKNKHSARSLTAFLVTWAFVVLTVTGLVLYVVPHGRVAYWVHWSLAGMEKEQWAWVHMMFGGVFIVTGVLHLYFNWKPFKQYFADRIKGHLALKREVFIATALTVAIFIVSALNIPPASWVIDLNSAIKGSWVTSPELEPPFGHAEEISVAGIARRIRFDLDTAMGNLHTAGVRVESPQASLEQIARANGITPMQVYAFIREGQQPAEPAMALDPGMSVEEIEAKFAGTGLGRKTIAELCAAAGVDPAVGLARLSAQGVVANETDNVRGVAELHAKRPIDLMRIVLQP